MPNAGVFTVSHRDKHVEIPIGTANSLEEAVTFIKERYGAHSVHDNQWAVIRNPQGEEISQTKVGYMSLVAVRKFDQTYDPVFISSSGNKSYVAQINDNGIVSCNCTGWAMWAKKKKGLPRSCKHTDLVIRREKLEIEPIKPGDQYVSLVNKSLQNAKAKFKQLIGTPKEKLAALIAEFEAARARLMTLDIGDAFFRASQELDVAKFKMEGYMELMAARGED